MAVSDTLRDHETHRHEWYGLTCEIFDQMLAACDYSCQVCGCPSIESSCGKLVIDHDSTVGDWAVRGLLCTRCNVTLRVDRPDPDWALSYLTNPWYKRMLAEKGLTPELPEYTDWSLYGGHLIEPQVTDFARRLWTRLPGGKWSNGGSPREAVSWHKLVRQAGPHNLKPRILGETVISAAEAEIMRGRKGPFEVRGLTPAQRIDVALVILNQQNWPRGCWDKIQEVTAALKGETVVF